LVRVVVDMRRVGISWRCGGDGGGVRVRVRVGVRVGWGLIKARETIRVRVL
jgi:hypothetical protein